LTARARAASPGVGHDGGRDALYGALGDDEGGAPAQGLGGEEGPVVLKAGDRDEGEAGTDGPRVVRHSGDGFHAPGQFRSEDSREVCRVQIHAG
jgi:hypothetical protein